LALLFLLLTRGAMNTVRVTEWTPLEAPAGAGRAQNYAPPGRPGGLAGPRSLNRG
jgi:hypothetical protein